MRLRLRALVLAAAACVVALAGVPASAQEVITLEGTVSRKVDGKSQPIEGALVDIYRTDIKTGKWNVKTNKSGRFVVVGVPIRAVVTIIVSGPAMQPQYRTGIRGASPGDTAFVLEAGDGSRPTLEEVANVSGSAPTTAPRVSEEERKKMEEARAAEEAEVAKNNEMREDFNARVGHFDLGVKANEARDYKTGVAELTAALEGADVANPKYAELIHKASGNLAEAHYQVGVDYYNASNKDGAKQELTAAAKAIETAVKIDPENAVYNAIQGKTLLLLVDKFGDTKSAEIAAAAFTKAASVETDPARKLDYMIKIGEAYRTGFIGEFNNRDYSEERANALKQKAFDAYKAVIAQDANNAKALYGIGLTAMASTDAKDYQTAANYLKLLVDKAPNDPTAAYAKTTLATLEKDFKIKPKPVQ